jgi:hypothetical protein
MYDETLKSLFGQEVAEILPILIPEAEFISGDNIEIDRTIVKADLLFWANYKGQRCLVNMELQSSQDDTIVMRLLMYHACFHYKHKVPVLSVLLCPFETKFPDPPYREQVGDEALLTFEYKKLPLWEKDARVYVQEHHVCLYTLLPAMRHATVPLLKQALHQMRQHYTSNKRFGDHLVRFNTIMQRSTTMTEPEKQEMEEELEMVYKIDQFFDGNPRVEKRVERGVARGMQRLILAAIQDRFPTVADQAQPQLEQIQDTDTLETLFRQLMTATTERDVRRILHIQENQ